MEGLDRGGIAFDAMGCGSGRIGEGGMRPKPLTIGTQNERVWTLLKRGSRLTQRRALRLGVDRLASRVHELKALGYRIKSVIVKVGDGKRIAQYFVPRGRRAC